MKFIEKLFKQKNKSSLKVRFSKTDNQWQVYRESHLVYLGSKLDCLNFMDNQLIIERSIALN